MKTFNSHAKKNLVKNKKGQAVTEYILLLALVAALCGTFTKTILGGFDTSMLVVGGNLEKALRSGRADVDVWRN